MHTTLKPSAHVIQLARRSSIMQSVRELTQAEVDQVLVTAVKDLILPILETSKPGHCLRISSLPDNVMRQVCSELNNADLNKDIVFYILSPNQASKASWQISTTRLIELRNEKKRALLAFIPPGLKAPAEDS